MINEREKSGRRRGRLNDEDDDERDDYEREDDDGDQFKEGRRRNKRLREDELTEKNREERRRKEYLEATGLPRGAPLKEIMTSYRIIQEGQIRSHYPSGERLTRYFLCRAKTTIENLLVPTAINIMSENENKVVQLTIQETSNLEMDQHVIHPFVRVHFVELQTGKYLPKSKQEKAIYAFEKITCANQMKSLDDFACETIPPFCSNANDLRVTGRFRAIWNEAVLINESPAKVFNENTLILFEILDFSKELLAQKKHELLDHDGYYRVAWAYLRPHGCAGNHQGTNKLQLYRYKFRARDYHRENKDGSVLHVAPAVYFDFVWPTKTKYSGYLTVTLSEMDPPKVEDVTQPPKNVFQRELGLRNNQLSKSRMRRDIAEEEDTDESKRKKKQLLLRRRFAGEECILPEKVLFKLPSERLGCFRISFSPNGRLLAAACTRENSRTVVKVFEMEQGELIVTLKGHRNLVHDMAWDSESEYLLTAGSDYALNLWRMPPETSAEEIDEDESERICFMTTADHPGYVYCCRFFQEKYRENRKLLISGCFDGLVRFWMMEMEINGVRGVMLQELPLEIEKVHRPKEESTNLLDHRHPNAMVLDENDRLYIGDSLGYVHVWDVEVRHGQLTINRLHKIKGKEILGDPINSLNLHPPDNKLLVVHSRDNFIRTIDPKQKGEVIQRYFGSKSSKAMVRSVVSPDGSYLLSGSEDGRPHLWWFTSGAPIGTEFFELSVKGLVSDVAWNNEYNMIAVCTFSAEFPILVYVHEKQDIFEEMGTRKKVKRNLLEEEKDDEEVLSREENEEDVDLKPRRR